ncbi:UNVERIFIED_CONTAM: hypothetical protein HDU68_006441 [Siphonaria sp. JEL0065]|nr:hypothetical protein HDU68_006441 [Siphonaria sp. JEL0065]
MQSTVVSGVNSSVAAASPQLAQVPKAPGLLSRHIRLVTGLAMLMGGTWAIDTVLNRETELLDGKVDYNHLSRTPGRALVENNNFIRDYLNETYRYVAVGASITFASAYALHKNAAFQRGMIKNPVGITLASLMTAGAISNIAFLTPPEHLHYKYPLFAAFALTKGVFLSSALVISPPLLYRAGIYTFGLVGSMAWLGATTKSDNYIWTGGPLLGALSVSAIGLNIKNLLPPAMYAMPPLFSLYLYGGLTIFGAFVLKDMEKVVRHGERVHDGLHPRDTLNEALRLYTDFMSIVP